MPWSISQLLHLPPCLNSPKSDDERSPPHNTSMTVEKGNVGRGCDRGAEHTGDMRGGAGVACVEPVTKAAVAQRTPSLGFPGNC
ncbi:hypothetical protein ERO13_A11G116250v2 [Gossypium hirsutum]|uniref:Uncharacterized protein n=1 Tax=Gossypium darwinii TaxID=34276 RepID=A0A5D2EKQ5_GOSDA|nr:hypothetical protein ERO13_A11G116250v2 [Gossypium hirsutum]KAG4174362.1 hypothetical protein ERO13_A11G116250v2 [Gossypium hirsutum]TYG93721.1 hypothetical protein ES288_A11G133300v1 [Gossypium darwinii]